LFILSADRRRDEPKHSRLPKSDQQFDEWQAAVEVLLLVVELNGPTMMARIGVMRALNHGKPDPKIVPPRKRAKAYTIVR
jgi:hypothetical protein